MNAIAKFVMAAAAVGCLSTSAACYHHTYTAGTGGDTSKAAKYSNWHSHFLFGIIGDKNVKIKEVCPSGNATVKNHISFLNGLVGAFIGLIYYPTTVQVFCGDGEAASVELTPEELREIGKSAELRDWARSVSPVKAAELEEAIRLHEERVSNVASAPATTRF